GGPIGKAVGGPILNALSLVARKNWPRAVADLGAMGIKDQNPAANPPGDDDLSGTAVQVAAAYAMADDGVYHQPFEVNEVSEGGQVIWQARPSSVRYPFSPYQDGIPVIAGPTAGSDGGDQWAWTAGRSRDEEVAVSMYATKP